MQMPAPKEEEKDEEECGEEEEETGRAIGKKLLDDGLIHGLRRNKRKNLEAEQNRAVKTNFRTSNLKFSRNIP
jgi:hypothetical protein